MKKYLTTYDLKETKPSPHKAFLDAAEAEGLVYVLKLSNGALARLPNTTLWGEFPNRTDAIAAFNRAKAAAETVIGRSIKLEKRIFTRLVDSSVTSDEGKEPEPDLVGATDLETCRLHQLHDSFFE